MAERGVIVEFDFTALNGAELLFETTKEFLQNLDGIAFDIPTEARFLSGGNYQGGLQDLFARVKTKKTAQKAARDLAAAFNAALAEAVPRAITPAFKNFVKTLADRGVKVVLSTRADLARVQEAFAPVLGENVSLYHEESTCYGSVKWDAWRRACVAHRLLNLAAIAVTGSGFGVKSALLAGLGAVAVVNPHVAYQDFSGADAILKDLSAPTAKTLLGLLKLS